MRETSFGKMQALLMSEEKAPRIEHLIFEKEGRPHRHNEFETFVVLSGEGLVIHGKNEVPVRPGSLVTIPPKALHWMKPANGQILEGFLWYHESELSQP